jgi:hypothetical protein
MNARLPATRYPHFCVIVRAMRMYSQAADHTGTLDPAGCTSQLWSRLPQERRASALPWDRGPRRSPCQDPLHLLLPGQKRRPDDPRVVA